jgi:Iron only hydrogenase large subunit, C-terminal domain
MTPVNNVRRFRREVLIRLVKAFMTGRMVEVADKIPYEMYPKDSESPRCCIYKSRAITRSACLAGMGFMLEHDEDDSIPLAHYARLALERKCPESPIITVNEIACKACVPARYFITNACQGCIARQCAVSCNFDAISFKDGQAVIDPAKCKNCGRCRDACPYQAITRIAVPCEGACPVKAIHKSEDGMAEIDFDKCTSCGRCMRACPFTALLERSQVIDVLGILASGRKVVALLAPAIVGQFPGSLAQIKRAILRLGFAEAVEVAHGADITASKEAEEFKERMERGDKFMTTSCCPAYVETVRRHAKELLPHVSETKTPMHYLAAAAKERDPDSVVVFIGPCVAKRYEGIQDEFVDYVLTFEEVGSLFVAKDIDVAACEDLQDNAEDPTAEARGFAITGGVAGAVASKLPAGTEIACHCVNGLSPQGVAQLRSFVKGKAPATLIEVMTCEGGCVGGAGVLGEKTRTTKAIQKFIKKA